MRDESLIVHGKLGRSYLEERSPRFPGETANIRGAEKGMEKVGEARRTLLDP